MVDQESRKSTLAFQKMLGQGGIVGNTKAPVSSDVL
jgi:hypothetical protein